MSLGEIFEDERWIELA